MAEQNEEDDDHGGRRLKVARLIDEYGLDGLGAELEQRWTADEQRQSLRELADYFNQELLRRVMTEADMQTVDGEVANTYRILTGDDVSDADRTRIRRRLDREGLDVESVTDDFVTYQAVRTYLQRDRDAEYSRSEADPIERTTSHLEKLRGRTVSVTEQELEQLRNGGQITLGDFRTLVEIQVVCEECNTRYEVTELLERGGCDCDQE